MDKIANREHAVELLQQLGLKEYEAKAFVALSRLPRGTAKEISDVSEVPRTRVYDAVRVLETKGLVEIQHSNPQVFRAVAIDEAIGTLRNEYDDRVETLRQTLQGLDPAVSDEESEVTHEVWALAGEAGITSRTAQLIDEADSEVVIVLGHRNVFTDDLADRLQQARRRGVDVIIGTVSEELRDRVVEALPETKVFVSELEWLTHSALPDDDTEIGRLLLADREAILVSSFHRAASGGQTKEEAVFGRGFDNGLVAIVRRILATGLLSSAKADDD
ncbi:TrmB family transcriptional regulator [Haloarcula nitratireducens]|uniref:TrmB family transcriptional regulator n=1 Tax=Haloarcula nitratireducens TaxID=2487749 RepID=A0AAW4PGT1_9EURY|nr:helix-turn-helix domain-containing protein [Halomicroarcula nitratireducens]MBX0297139.1 TrmB family transcriptional regulator [Halomicroarcula nitratireducens]